MELYLDLNHLPRSWSGEGKLLTKNLLKFSHCRRHGLFMNNMGYRKITYIIEKAVQKEKWTAFMCVFRL